MPELLLLDRFEIDCAAGLIKWEEPPANHAGLKGKIAGCPVSSHGKPYWVIQIDGRKYKRGHLIFLAAYGYLPKPCIDHINGNSCDDRLSNLRQATVEQNAWNHKTRAKKSALPRGVKALPSGRFQARISFKGQHMALGSFPAPQEAHAVYDQKRKELFGEYA